MLGTLTFVVNIALWCTFVLDFVVEPALKTCMSLRRHFRHFQEPIHTLKFKQQKDNIPLIHTKH